MVMLVLMKLLTLVVVGFGLRLLMLVGFFLVYVGGGILLFWLCIGFLWPFLVLLLIVIPLLIWPLTLLFGLLEAFPRRRRVIDVVRDVALLPGPRHLWDSGWVRVPPVAVTAEDVRLWPYSVDILVKLVSSLGSLHWPSASADQGPGGISFVDVKQSVTLF